MHADNLCNDGSMASFQFSLRRLLIGVSIVCVASALAAAFPELALMLGFALVLLGPGLVVAAGASVLAVQKIRTFFVVLAGAFVGGILAPERTGAGTAIDGAIDRVMLALPCVTGGAVLAAGMALFIDFLARPRTRSRR